MTRRRYAPALEQMLRLDAVAERHRLRLPLRIAAAGPIHAHDDRSLPPPTGRIGGFPRLRWANPHRCCGPSCTSSACSAATTCCARCARRWAPPATSAAVFPPAMIEFFAVRVAFELEGADPAGAVHLHIRDHAGAAAGLWLRWSAAIPRRVFLPVVYGFFIATLLVFYVMFDSGVPGRGMAFFLWITVFNLFAVAVFWSFMADVYDNVEARRYYGYIGAAGTLGAIFGPMLTRTLVERVGIANLMLVSAGFLAVVHRLPAAPAPPCGASARQQRNLVERRSADGRAGAGRPEADRARTAAALDGGVDPVRRGRWHPAVQRAGRDRAAVLCRPGSWPRRTTRTSTWR